MMCESVADSVTSISEEEQEFEMSLDDLNYSDKDGDEEDEFDESEDDFESDVTLEEDEDGGLDLAKHSRVNDLSMPQVMLSGKCADDTAEHSSNALVPVSEADDPYSVDSDEEKELLKDIKDEIKTMVRAEMKEELAAYEHKTRAIEVGCLPLPAGNEIDKYPDLADMEPELRDAFIKMRKLDRILEKRMKQEQKVKRERIILEQRIRCELVELQSKGPIQKDIKANTDKFITLALPASHNEGVDTNLPPVTPVFQTQVKEDELKARLSNTGQSSTNNSEKSSAASNDTNTADSRQENGSTKKYTKKRKNFIKRNKELAANAKDTVAMTDDEKKRLKELLTDIESLPDIPEEGLDTQIKVDENHFQMMLQPGEGFVPTDNELQTLTTIDQRLQCLLPEEEFRSISNSVLSTVPQQRLFVRVDAQMNADFELYGERVLVETKEERELQAKLKRIEEQLAAFHLPEEIQMESPALTDEQLDSLLDQCARSLSSTFPPDTPDSMNSERSLESARARLLENPPHLSDDVLQKLLSEAHFPLSTHLLDLQDDDSKSAQNGEGQIIKADTWKAIAEQTLEVTDAGGDEGRWSPRKPLKNVGFSAHQSYSETSMHSTSPRQTSVLHSYSQQLIGRESPFSLPDISVSRFLVNTPQGQPLMSANNDPMTYRNSRTSSQAKQLTRNGVQ
ncbi:hypothetical protein C0Q70_13108 [Pomacea canaliculata]|uniref:Fibrous sheath-interacting protein 1 n=1 Tax=Pomacea canaliculata TaxID=400727 RepID=A0A2T7NWB6_POMCA|nr:fibrous sheath-interacting protein 1-like [Pomacea canaliculata]XP_025103448.1 fibrous sheath-interacting protein 1-like [Pomacea canaliculata]PVD25452.1 hypothetical protein C0Q70_13108 [Pomacea canaliculata]